MAPLDAICPTLLTLAATSFLIVDSTEDCEDIQVPFFTEHNLTVTKGLKDNKEVIDAAVFLHGQSINNYWDLWLQFLSPSTMQIRSEVRFSHSPGRIHWEMENDRDTEVELRCNADGRGNSTVAILPWTSSDISSGIYVVLQVGSKWLQTTMSVGAESFVIRHNCLNELEHFPDLPFVVECGTSRNCGQARQHCKADNPPEATVRLTTRLTTAMPPSYPHCLMVIPWTVAVLAFLFGLCCAAVAVYFFKSLISERSLANKGIATQGPTSGTTEQDNCPYMEPNVFNNQHSSNKGIVAQGTSSGTTEEDKYLYMEPVVFNNQHTAVQITRDHKPPQPTPADHTTGQDDHEYEDSHWYDNEEPAEDEEHIYDNPYDLFGRV